MAGCIITTNIILVSVAPPEHAVIQSLYTIDIARLLALCPHIGKRYTRTVLDVELNI